MRTILYPTDFTEAANKAYIYALQIARATGAEILTLHVYQSIALAAGHMRATLSDYVEETFLESLQNYRQTIPVLKRIAEVKGYADVEVSHMLNSSELIHAGITKTAKKEDVDLIVLGTTGAAGYKKYFKGSVAGEVMEHSGRPTLAIPENAVFDGRIDQLAFAAEFNDKEKDALIRLTDFAALFSGHVICVNHSPMDEQTFFSKSAEWSSDFPELPNLDFKHIPPGEGGHQDRMIRVLKEQKVDVLGSVIYKKNIFQELFDLSKTKRLSYHTDMPIFSMLPKAPR